jgi:hypothetical protein
MFLIFKCVYFIVESIVFKSEHEAFLLFGIHFMPPKFLKRWKRNIFLCIRDGKEILDSGAE